MEQNNPSERYSPFYEAKALIVAKLNDDKAIEFVSALLDEGHEIFINGNIRRNAGEWLEELASEAFRNGIVDILQAIVADDTVKYSEHFYGHFHSGN